MRDLSDLQPSLRTSNLRWTRKEDLPRLMDEQDPSADLVSVIEQAGLRRASRTLFEDRVVQWDLTPVDHYAVALSADLSNVPGAENKIQRLTQDTFGFKTLDNNASAGVYFPRRVPNIGRYYFLWHSNFDVPNSQGGSENLRFLNANNTTAALIGIDDATGGLYEQTGGLFVSNNGPLTPRLVEVDVDNNTIHVVYIDQNNQPQRALAFEGSVVDTEIRLEVNRGENTHEDLLFVFSANAQTVPEPLSPTNGFTPYPDPFQPRFPDNVRPSELLRVTVSGTFNGVDFAVNEGAIVSNLYPQEVLPLKGPSGTVIGPEDSVPRTVPVFETEYGNKLTKTNIKIDIDDALFGFSKKYITHTEATLELTSALNGCRVWFTHQQGCVVTVPEGVVFPKGFHVELVQAGGIVQLDASAVTLLASHESLETTGLGTSVLLSHIEDDLWWGTGEGLAGLSAYQVAVANGFEGSVSDWLDSLRGQDGIGIRILGSLPSPSDLPLSNNDNGDAYIIQQVMWVYDGSTWVVASQAGPRGKSAYQVAQDDGFQGSVTQWLNSLKGQNAYQIAKAIGQIAPTVTEEEWLESLKGDSAFLVAKAEGFEGNRAEWLESLRGPQGDDGPPGPKGDPAAAIDEPRFEYDQGVFQGLLVDDSISEAAALNTIENFDETEGGLFMEADLDNAQPFPGSGFNELLTGSGKLLFVWSGSTGKCFANGSLLYEVNDFTMVHPTDLVSGGLASVRKFRCLKEDISDTKAQEETQSEGTFQINSPV